MVSLSMLDIDIGLGSSTQNIFPIHA